MIDKARLKTLRQRLNAIDTCEARLMLSESVYTDSHRLQFRRIDSLRNRIRKQVVTELNGGNIRLGVSESDIF
jgi:hypothetical protein